MAEKKPPPIKRQTSDQSDSSESCTSLPKGILKTSPSFEQHPPSAKKSDIAWDEMNILETYHPANKDYGHMKINEPDTPFNRGSIDVEDDDAPVNSEELASRLAAMDDNTPSSSPRSGSMDVDSDDDLTDVAKVKKSKFNEKRKKHYNEFQAVEMARKLIEKEMREENGDDDDDDYGSAKNSFVNCDPSTSQKK